HPQLVTQSPCPRVTPSPFHPTTPPPRHTIGTSGSSHTRLLEEDPERLAAGAENSGEADATRPHESAYLLPPEQTAKVAGAVNDADDRQGLRSVPIDDEVSVNRPDAVATALQFPPFVPHPGHRRQSPDRALDVLQDFLGGIDAVLREVGPDAVKVTAGL